MRLTVSKRQEEARGERGGSGGCEVDAVGPCEEEGGEAWRWPLEEGLETIPSGARTGPPE